MFKRPRDLASPERLLPTLLGVMRSAAFLSTFVQLMWLGVCSTRTFLVARLFPCISHDYFDGPYGCIFVASLICGSSIWIENPRRRGEIALYVLPRAIRTVLSDSWLGGGRRRIQFAERLNYALPFFVFTVFLTELTFQNCLRRFVIDITHFCDSQTGVASRFVEVGRKLRPQRLELPGEKVIVIPPVEIVYYPLHTCSVWS